MSEQDFEIYLSLLGKLLGLRTDQREEINQELRDHLENRLHELLDAGHSKQEAVELALEEFGDAAGLANQFVSITHQQRKRWIMRFATFAIAGCFLMALFVFSFWPEGGKVQVVSSSIGQSDDPFGGDPFGAGPPAADDPFGTGSPSADDPFSTSAQQKQSKGKAGKAPVELEVPSTEEEKTRATEDKLNQLIQVDFFEMELEDAISVIAEMVNAEFYIKKSQLDEVGMSPDESVPDLSSKSIRASMALDLLLHQMNLDYVVRDGIVIVTSAEDVEVTHEIRVYDCTDITNLQVNRIQKPTKRRKKGNDEMMEMEMMDSMGGMEGMMEEDMMMDSMMGGGMGGGMGGPQQQAQDLVGLISATVRPDSWEQLGGNGSISQFQGLIVINNNARAHRETEKLLEKIRAARKLAVK